MKEFQLMVFLEAPKDQPFKFLPFGLFLEVEKNKIKINKTPDRSPG